MTPAPEVPFSPLVAQVITAQHEWTRQVTDSLVGSLQHQVAELQAHADAVTDGIERLLAGDFMPTPAAIRRALYPSAEVVASYRRPEES